MPEVQRENLPPALFAICWISIPDRSIGADQLGLLAEWLDTHPQVPTDRGFKRFPGMTVCGEGEWVKRFFSPPKPPWEKK